MGYHLAQKEALGKRIVEALQKDPSLTNTQLVERFGCGVEVITRIRRKINVKASLSEYVTPKEMKSAKKLYGLFEDTKLRWGRGRRRKKIVDD